jgi:hypothetical protein
VAQQLGGAGAERADEADQGGGVWPLAG